MASLFRPTYTKADSTGRRVTRKVRRWYGKYRNAENKLRCIPLNEHKTAAMAMLTDLVRQTNLRRAGILDQATEHLDLPIDQHVGDFRMYLEANRRSPKHISETIRVVRKVASACGLKVLADLQGATDNFEGHRMIRLQGGASHRTVNADLVATRSFCRWLIRRKRMHDDPTAGLQRLNEDEDRRKERRALSDEEAQRLYAATYDSNRLVRRLSGPDRAMLYLLAQRTGLRRGELRSLTPNSFDFSAEPSYVTVRAARPKRRRQDMLPLSRDIAEALQEHLAGSLPNELVWPGSWWQISAKMLRQDLADAGIESVDNAGRIVDFHSLRTTFITSLARAGVMPATAQKLARHSDINLTIGTYTRLQMSELADAVGRLPKLAPRTTLTQPRSEESATSPNILPMMQAKSQSSGQRPSAFS